MPTVGVFRDSLQAALAPFEVTEESFDELCFEFGLELDDVTSELQMAKNERGGELDEETARGLSNREIYKVDVPANRYDLLCLEGLVRSLQIFKGKKKAPMYKVLPAKPVANMQMTVYKETAQIRPYVVAAVLRGVTFDQDRYQSFIDLQDMLHHNICKQRELVAIGTHDLSTLSPPFTYEARDPKNIWFRPLNQDREMDGHGMMEVLSQHKQLKKYLNLIQASPVYPVIYDSKGVVLSLPPIINGDHSKIRLETKDVFIECTAKDLTKANIVLNTVVTMFAEYCSKEFVAEPVEVIYASDYPANSFTKGGDRIIYPKLETRPMQADIARMKNSLSLQHLSGNDVRDLLQKMSVPCEIDKKDKNILNVDVPVTRSDIMHECDLVEDLAIAYGYNNLHLEVPNTFAGAAGQPVNHLSDLLRQEMAMTGFTECLNWALVSRAENYTMMKREEKTEDLWRPVARPYEYNPNSVAVSISKPKTVGFEILRTSMLPGLLKCLGCNKHNPPPIKLFEVGDVVVQEPTEETMSKNVRRICAITASTVASFQDMHGVVDQIMYKLKCTPEHEHTVQEEGAKGIKRRPYKLVPSEDPSFFPGMQANVLMEEQRIGVVGILHPEVVGSSGFKVDYPCSALELNLEPFLEWL